MFLDLQLISIVDNCGMKELLQEAEERYVIPSGKTFRNNIFPALYNKAENKLKALIAEYNNRFGIHCLHSITTDCWTSCTMTSLRSIHPEYGQQGVSDRKFGPCYSSHE